MLSPYHLKSYQLSLSKIPFYKDAEEKFIELAKNNSIKIIGSYSADKTKCKNDEFYNGDHAKASCMKKIFQQIK